MIKQILILCLLTPVAIAQTPKIDSLKRVLVRLQNQPPEHSRDTLLFKTLKAVMNDFSDINLDSSFRYNTRLIAHCEQTHLPKELIYAYQFAGYLHQIKGEHHQSIRVHYQALMLAEKLRQYNRIAVSQGALAHAYVSLTEYEKARKLCLQGLDVLQKHPDSYIKLSILNVLGSIYREQGKLTDALTTNQAFYALAKAEKNEWYESQSLHAIGWVYKEMGDFSKALVYFLNALTRSRQTGSHDLEGSILLNITRLYLGQQNWTQAIRYCTMARQTATKVNLSSVVVEADELFYEIYKRMGNTPKALKAYESYVMLRDSLSQERNEQRIEALQAQYDNAQKESALQKQQVLLLAQKNQNGQLAQIRNGLFAGIAAILVVAGLLYWNNRRLQLKNGQINQQRILLETAQTQLADVNRTLETRVDERTAELVTANQELIQKNEEIKAALFKGQTIERKRVALELHDNLSSLLSAVNMSMQYINPQNLTHSEQSVYQNVKQLIQNAYSEVRNISHNILPATLEKEGLITTLTTLVNQLNQNSPLRFTFTISGLTERLPVEIEFNLYSIVLELINNVIKHAQATTVAIDLSQTTNGIDLTVADNGVGLGSAADKRGVGLQNIQARLDSLGGTFETNQSTKTGTRIQIKIPIDTVFVNGNSDAL